MHEQDKDEIRYCIDAAFRAYMDRDWVAINVGHTEDWCGFTIHSRSIVQSNEAYVTETEAALEGVELIDYEMLEIHYAFYGAVCVVPYVARLRGTRTRDNLIEIKLCVLDVYLRQDGSWRQVAGNISLHPDTLADPEGTWLCSDGCSIPPGLRLNCIRLYQLVWKRPGCADNGAG